MPVLMVLASKHLPICSHVGLIKPLAKLLMHQGTIHHIKVWVHLLISKHWISAFLMAWQWMVLMIVKLLCVHFMSLRLCIESSSSTLHFRRYSFCSLWSCVLIEIVSIVIFHLLHNTIISPILLAGGVLCLCFCLHLLNAARIMCLRLF